MWTGGVSRFDIEASSSATSIVNAGLTPFVYYINGSEQMRLTSTGLGIGTSSPAYKLDVFSASANVIRWSASGTSKYGYLYNDGNGVGLFDAVSAGGNGMYVYTTNNTLWFNTNGTTKAILDSSGNLGLGVTPSAWAAPFGSGVLEFSGGFIAGSSSNNATRYGLNSYYNGSNYIYKTTNFASAYVQSSSTHQWFNAPSGTAGNAITFTQAMTLDASGNLGIGVTNPNGWRLNLSSGAAGNLAQFTDGISSTFVITTASGSTATIGQANNGPLAFITNNTERVRIDSSGNLLVGTTSQAGTLTVQDIVTDGSFSNAGVFKKASANTTNYYIGARISLQNTSATAGNFSTVAFQTANGNDYAAVWGVCSSHTTGTGAGSLVFGTSNNDGVAVERARIDSSGNLLVGTTSTSGSTTNTSVLVNGGVRTADGNVSATTATATTIFGITAALRGRYEVVALIANSGNAALYTSIATVIWDGSTGRIVANNGTNLTITLSSANVQITQVSGSTQTVYWSYQLITL